MKRHFVKHYVLFLCFSVLPLHARDFLKGTLAWSMQRQAAQFVPDVMITQNDIGTGGTFTITQPGTYGLAEDITFTTGTAITIDSDDVYLDLDGHTIDGLGNVGTIAINSSVAHTNLIIRNGVITNVGIGIRVISGDGSYNAIDIHEIKAITTTADGINIQNATSVFLKDNEFIDCLDGITLNSVTRSSIVACQAYNCTRGYKIANLVAVTNIIIKECFAEGGTNGFFFSAITDGLIINNCAQACTGVGISSVGAGPRVQFFSNAANGNGTNYVGVPVALIAVDTAAIAAANNYWFNVATTV